MMPATALATWVLLLPYTRPTKHRKQISAKSRTTEPITKTQTLSPSLKLTKGWRPTLPWEPMALVQGSTNKRYLRKKVLKVPTDSSVAARIRSFCSEKNGRTLVSESRVDQVCGRESVTHIPAPPTGLLQLAANKQACEQRCHTFAQCKENDTHEKNANQRNSA